MNRTISRGDNLYSITGRWRRYQVSVRCDCALGPHWHTLARSTPTIKDAYHVIAQHAYGRTTQT